MKCFKFKDDLLCEDEVGSFIMFEKGTKCTVLGSSKYCLTEGEFNRVRDFGATKYASISDLNQIRDAFIVNQERDNYNSFIVSVKLKKMQQFILGLVSSLSKTNPKLLNSYLSGDYFTRPLENNVYEVCPCEKSQRCEIKEFHHPNMKFCPNSINWKALTPFNIDKKPDYVIDEKFSFQGKDTHRGVCS